MVYNWQASQKTPKNDFSEVFFRTPLPKLISTDSPYPKVASDSHKKKTVLPQTVYQILLNVIYQPTTRIGFNNSGLKSSVQENLPHFFWALK